MNPATNNYDIHVNQGTDFILPCFWGIDADTPINLTGYSIAGMVRSTYSDVSPTFSFTVAISDQNTNPGEFYLSISKATTSAIPITSKTTYKYDVELTDSSSNVSRILEGKLYLHPEVTK